MVVVAVAEKKNEDVAGGGRSRRKRRRRKRRGGGETNKSIQLKKYIMLVFKINKPHLSHYQLDWTQWKKKLKQAACN